jgi:hypothetical protein
MMENNNFRSIPTSLFLNGPKLSIVSNPQSITESAGVATFTGIATAIYEDSRFELDGGSIDIRWYFDGQRILDSSVDPNSRATIVGFNSITGTGSTIVISNLDGNDNGKLVYFEADYIPAAYSYPVGSDVIAGTARSTANAFNEPLPSSTATLTARPIIIITEQPGIVSSFYNVENTFTIEAETSPANIVNNNSLLYQWQIDGVDISDGVTTEIVDIIYEYDINVSTSNNGVDTVGSLNIIKDSNLEDPPSFNNLYYKNPNSQTSRIKLDFKTPQKDITKITINGGGYQGNFNLYINDVLVEQDRPTVDRWGNDEITIPSTNIRSIEIEGENGYALGNLRLNDVTVIGTIGYSVPTSNTLTTSIFGAKTSTLIIKTNRAYNSTVRCIVSNPDTRNSPVISNEVSFFIREPRNILNIETYDNSSIATLSQIDLDKEEITLTYATHPGNSICVYAPEKDVKVQVGLYGGKGSDNGSRKGGNGGISVIEVVLERNVEYIFTGLFPFVNTPFFYRQGQLLAAVGGGGNAGSSGTGGSGGGIGQSGGRGSGTGNGAGGQAVPAGQLQEDGIFGSRTSLEPEDPDTKATFQSGGRVTSCTKGVYWRAQGFSACQDIGQSQFRISDGTLVTNSAEIIRGYKDGYNLIQTSGAAESTNSGHGGNGATGGNGGTSNSGGGGGSGYTSGSAIIYSSLNGAWDSTSKVTISLNTGFVLWEGTNGRNITFSNDRLSFTATGNGNGYQSYSTILPSIDRFYFDVTLDGGYDTGKIGFLGVCNTTNAITFFNYDRYTAWYWRAVYLGKYQKVAWAQPGYFERKAPNENNPANLDGGKYRIAIDRTRDRMYVKRLTPNESASGYIEELPQGDLRLMLLTQFYPSTNGYPQMGAKIENNGTIYTGSGGLY